MINDPIIEEVRKAGKEIARESGYDLHVLCENLRKNILPGIFAIFT